MNNINKDFIKAVLKEEKLLLQNNEVKRIVVPRYDELAVDDMLKVM